MWLLLVTWKRPKKNPNIICSCNKVLQSFVYDTPNEFLAVLLGVSLAALNYTSEATQHISLAMLTYVVMVPVITLVCLEVGKWFYGWVTRPCKILLVK